MYANFEWDDINFQVQNRIRQRRNVFRYDDERWTRQEPFTKRNEWTINPTAASHQFHTLLRVGVWSYRSTSRFVWSDRSDINTSRVALFKLKHQTDSTRRTNSPIRHLQENRSLFVFHQDRICVMIFWVGWFVSYNHAYSWGTVKQTRNINIRIRIRNWRMLLLVYQMTVGSSSCGCWAYKLDRPFDYQ